jgi:hypothetical protein
VWSPTGLSLSLEGGAKLFDVRPLRIRNLTHPHGTLALYPCEGDGDRRRGLPLFDQLCCELVQLRPMRPSGVAEDGERLADGDRQPLRKDALRLLDDDPRPQRSLEQRHLLFKPLVVRFDGRGRTSTPARETNEPCRPRQETAASPSSALTSA